MFDAAIPSIALYPRERFDTVINSMDAAELSTAIKYLVCINPKHEQSRKALIAEGMRDEACIKAARELIHAATESKNFIGSSPIVSIERLRFPMIKKNNEMLFKRARSNIIQACDVGDLTGLDPQILGEMRSRSDL